MAGNEHLMESKMASFERELFFQDKLNVFEMYNGVKKAAQIPELGMGKTLEYLEKTYPILVENNQKYL